MLVKICGITTEEDALLAVALGADALGFVFAPSPRQVTVARVHDIVGRLPPEILTVGVFRDESPERVVDTVHRAGLSAAQLHGHETPEQAQWVRSKVPMVIQAFRADDAALARAREYGVDAVLVDAATPGSGRVFDWSLAHEVPDGLRLVLAGGLTPDNVGDAIAQVKPWGVDVSTGVEEAPGRKSPSLVRRFVAAAREAEPDGYEPGGEGPFDWQHARDLRDH